MSAPSNGRCPLCRRPAVPEHAPFCSARCHDRDLLNWLGDAYAVPGPPADPAETPLDND